MRFEFDATKSSTNRLKHGIDFIDAQALWSDPDRLEIAARSLDEPRWQIIGCIGTRCGLLDEIDREAGRLGVTRQAFITARLADAVLPRQANRTS